MSNINLIGINGLAGNGKDLVGKIIQYLTTTDKEMLKWFNKEPIKALYDWNGNFDNLSNWQIKKFADKLKDIVCLLTGCTRKQLEDQEFKNTRLSSEWIREEIKFRGKEEGHLSYRSLLQKIGTDLFRDQLHPNVWINSLFSEYKSVSDIKTSNIYTDERLQHGYKNTKIWRTYHNIKQRCYNPKHPRYSDYGERGIKMCKEWENSINSFINWAKENGYNENLTIDRINNDSNYSPDNCRCVSYSTQAINTKLRKDNTSGYKGVSKDKHNWRADIQINKKQYFLGYFDNPEQASEAYEEKFLERENLYETQEEKNLIYPLWLVTDLRFPNEYDAIKDRKGICIRVNRDYVLRGAEEDPKKLHPSETALNNHTFDYEIDNNGSIEDLIEEVRKMLQHFKIIE